MPLPTTPLGWRPLLRCCGGTRGHLLLRCCGGSCSQVMTDREGGGTVNSVHARRPGKEPNQDPDEPPSHGAPAAVASAVTHKTRPLVPDGAFMLGGEQVGPSACPGEASWQDPGTDLWLAGGVRWLHAACVCPASAPLHGSSRGRVEAVCFCPCPTHAPAMATDSSGRRCSAPHAPPVPRGQQGRCACSCGLMAPALSLQDCFGGCTDPAQGYHGLIDEVGWAGTLGSCCCAS